MITRWNDTGHAPLRISARMDEPIGYLDDLLHIDAQLAYGAYSDLDEQTRRAIPPTQVAEWPVDVALPLSTWWCDYVPREHGEVDPRLLQRYPSASDDHPPQLWGWCASSAIEAWAGRSKLEIRKKPPLAEFRRYTEARSHNVSSGHMKAYDLTIPLVLAREVVWYAHGDRDKVQYLLSRYVSAIGKKRNVGCGTVREWIVEVIDDDRSVCHDGKAMRRLPLGAAEGAHREGTIRPPYYWAAGRSVMAVEP